MRRRVQGREEFSSQQRKKPLGFPNPRGQGRRRRFEEEIEHHIFHIGYFFFSIFFGCFSLFPCSLVRIYVSRI